MTKRNKIARQILRLLKDFSILIVLGNGLSIFSIPEELWSVQMVLRNCVLSILIGYPVWKGITFIVLVLEERLPWLKYPIKRLIVQVFSMLALAGIVFFIGISLWVTLSEEVTFQTIDLMAISSLKFAVGFMILSMLVGNSVLFFKNWRNAAIKQEELKRAGLALQYQSLKNQIKPHFLFNSLSSLVTLINSDTDKATQFVHKLSDVYRYVLEQNDNELVAISDEVKFLEDYIFLQKIRFGNNLKVQLNLDMDKNRLIIPLSLQMMVENAIKHNEVSGDHPLSIDISFTKKNYIVIKNSRFDKAEMEDSLGIGIENLKRRVAFFTDIPLFIEENTEEFIVNIPTIIPETK